MTVSRGQKRVITIEFSAFDRDQQGRDPTCGELFSLTVSCEQLGGDEMPSKIFTFGIEDECAATRQSIEE